MTGVTLVDRREEARQAVPAQAASPEPSELLAATAHELRLPVSHIKGFVSSLRRDDVEWDEDTRRDFLTEIEQETDRLTQMLDSLLAARPSNADVAPKVEVVWVTPASVVKGGLNRIHASVGERPLRLDVSDYLPARRMNAGAMERVVANLVENAIKYSPPDTAIGISARITEDEELELAVEDEGPGVPAEDRERIFEPFYRKQTDVQSDVPGHGLGLAICQSVVLAHGGRMQVTGRHGGGARFSVLLPAPMPAAVPA
jgi:two-component system sensor histidine kinase KdpD